MTIDRTKLRELGWPERIYLQHGDDEIPPFEECYEVTWAFENIHGNDVEYVRADALEAAEQRMTDAKRKIEAAKAECIEPWTVAELDKLLKELQ